MNLNGHLWTCWPTARSLVRPYATPPSEPWTTTLEDPVVGRVRLTGRHHPHPGADTLAVIVHGLAGDPESPYCRRAAAAAAAAGLASLRLGLRGGGSNMDDPDDAAGADIYHAGLTEDVVAALRSPALERYRTIVIVGYSLGGHLVLRYALSPSDDRVRAVAAVCAPLDLHVGARAIDRGRATFYRGILLRGLRERYARLARHRPVPTPVEQVRAIRTIVDFDRHVVAPRHGFRSPDDYYTRAGVGPHLAELALPALWVGAERDPLVPLEAVRPWLRRRPPRLEVRWCRGGHVAFPPAVRLDLGSAGDGLEEQVIGWLARRAHG